MKKLYNAESFDPILYDFDNVILETQKLMADVTNTALSGVSAHPSYDEIGKIEVYCFVNGTAANMDEPTTLKTIDLEEWARHEARFGDEDSNYEWACALRNLADILEGKE